MSYPQNGHVEPGGPAAVRTVTVDGGSDAEIRKFSVGSMDNNVYLVTSGGQSLLIDAADDAERILQEIAAAGSSVATILTTHGHRDHWQALAEVAAATGAEVVFHASDDAMIGYEADRHVGDGETLSAGGATLRLLHTPGHTPGSICALLGEHYLFTGDTLFPGGPGNTFGNAQAFDQIMGSLEQRIFGPLGDDVWVYPGHGDDTTLGAERPHLDEWRERGW